MMLHVVSELLHGARERASAVKTWAVATSVAAGVTLAVALVAFHTGVPHRSRALPCSTSCSCAGKQGKSKQQCSSSKAKKKTLPEEQGEEETPELDLEDLGAEGEEARPQLLGAEEVGRKSKPRAGKSGAEEVAASHVPGGQRVYVRTFGCQHNQSDGEYMMGQLRDYGYTLVDSLEECDVCVVNSCTVKNPSESRGLNIVDQARAAKKPAVLAGCVPSGDKKLCASLKGVSMLDVSQLDRIVEVVEEAVKGHTVKLLEKRQKLSPLTLPKIRRDNLVEIIPINVGCFGNCTYCKTKFARGSVVSHPIDVIIARAQEVAAEGVRMADGLRDRKSGRTQYSACE